MAEDQSITRDKRLLAIAEEVGEAKDLQLPRILLKVQDILDSASNKPRQLSQLKQQVWELNLLSVMLTTVKQDFSSLPDKWNTATRLARIISFCSVGLSPSDYTSFKEKFLPSAAEVFLTLAKRIYTKYMKTSNVLEDTKKELIDSLKSTLDSVFTLCSVNEHLVYTVFSSAWFLQLLMTDDIPVAVLIMSYTQTANKLYRGMMGKLDQKIFYQILDELIFKLSTASNTELAGYALRTVVAICNSYESTVQLLCVRYKGLRPLLKAWTGKGFDRDLKMLNDLIDAGDYKQAKLARLASSASLIQAMWRSFATRKKLKSANTAIARFQRTYRSQRAAAEERKEEDRLQHEMEHWLVVERRRTMRRLRYKQLKAIEILPAADVPKYLQEEKSCAALSIQTRWRGYRVRANLDEKKLNMLRWRAAIKIQRQVRKWLERLQEQQRELISWQRPPGLTPKRREELQEEIDRHREMHPPKTVGEQKRQELHERVQRMLQDHMTSLRTQRHASQHRDALIGCIDTDAELVINAPSLAEVEEHDVPRYISHSLPVATKAKQDHQHKLSMLRQPWWKHLDEVLRADDDDVYEENVPDWKIF